jgi:hypothetical protein
MEYLIIVAIVIVIVYFVLKQSISSLKLENGKTLLLKVKRHAIRLDTEAAEKKELRFETVAVTQSVLKDKDGSFLVFEFALTDELYQFDHHSSEQVMKMLFDAKKIIAVYERNNLVFYRLFSTGGDVINLIVHQSSSQALRFAYGFSNKKFMEILKQIAPSSGSIETKFRKRASSFGHPEEAVKTRWRTVLETIDSLIIPLEASS